MILPDSGIVLPLRFGWRAWVYRGRRRAGSRRLGHLGASLVLFYAVYLR